MTNVCACFAVRSAALCLVPVSMELIEVSGFIRVFAKRILLRSGEIIIAPSILQSSKSFCAVKRQFILKPPSIMFWMWRFCASKTIIAPRLDLTISSITFLKGVPGETNLTKSMKVFSFSPAIYKKGIVSIYNFMLNLLN